MEGFLVGGEGFCYSTSEIIKKKCVCIHLHYLEERVRILIRFSCGYLRTKKTPSLG